MLGADVIKVEDPNEPDQSRESGGDDALNKALMGTGFMTQGSNKRSIALDLKTEGGRDALKRLVRDWADVLIENYRPGAFKALGLGYEDLSKLKPKLVYASMTAFGQDGPRGNQTAYDHAIQATSGITAATGTTESGPIKVGWLQVQAIADLHLQLFQDSPSRLSRVLATAQAVPELCYEPESAVGVARVTGRQIVKTIDHFRTS